MSSRINPRRFGGILRQVRSIVGTQHVWVFPTDRQRAACVAAQRKDVAKRRRARKLQRAARRRQRAAA